ncbi:MAG TPA: hypothetical protein ENI23_11335 [bacterium]|nr:hypothetical protein [bacterium]
MTSIGIKQVKEYPCLNCGKRFGKPAGTQKGHSHKELMRCMSTVSYKYTQLLDGLRQVQEASKKKENQKEEAEGGIKAMSEKEVQETIKIGQEIREASEEAIKRLSNVGDKDAKCDVAAEKSTKLIKKEQDSSSDAETGESTKQTTKVEDNCA